MLNDLKILLNIETDEKDNLLTLLIETVLDECRAIIHTDDIDGLEMVILQMAVLRYNQLGSEGLSSENYNGASFGYLNSYPDFIISALKAKRKLRVL